MANDDELSEIDWDDLYLSARSWGVQPSEFWEMSFPEWFCEAEARRDRQRGDYAGTLTRSDVDELTLIAAMTDEEWSAYNGNTAA